MEKMKVLAPAGSIESFYVALNNGADEIYIGINAFNARAKAVKNNLEELKKAIIDAHILGVQVFCTLNTLIFENELESITETIVTAINLGFDAFIVQDLAVVKLIKEIKSDAVIHLSTQLGIHNSFGAIMAKELGASRVVLSREASLDDIKAIKQAVPDMEIEYFVQGALCVAFSGNCYLSNRLLGKSGNRGECAQLCRLPYIAQYGEELKEKAYYLSPADLSLYSHLQELKDAGVTSLKIEGRLRSNSYIGSATSFYRNRVDELYLNKMANDDQLKQEINNLKISYNRGDYLKDGYLKKENFDNIIYKDFQNHIGIKIGSVKSCEKFKNIYKIKLNVNFDLKTNDGLKIIRNGKEVASLGVGNTEKVEGLTIIYSGQKLLAGDEVRLIHSSNLENGILLKSRKLKLEIMAEFKFGKQAKLTAFLNNQSITVTSDDILELAKTSPISQEDIIKSLSKLNDTVFELGKIEIILDNVFISKSALNELRRNLIFAITKLFSPKQINVDLNRIIQKINRNLINKQSNPLQVLNLNFVQTYNFDIKNSKKVHFFSDFSLFSLLNDINKEIKDKINIFLPPFINDADLKKIYNVLLLNASKIRVFANNIGQLYFAKKFETIASDFCNITNHIAGEMYKSLGASGVCLGYEIKNRNENYFNVNYKIDNLNILAFLSHCPYKAVINSTCKSCKFNDALSYTSESGVIYHINRYKYGRCYFFID